jgi:rare lipoprotein A
VQHNAKNIELKICFTVQQHCQAFRIRAIMMAKRSRERILMHWNARMRKRSWSRVCLVSTLLLFTAACHHHHAPLAKIPSPPRPTAAPQKGKSSNGSAIAVGYTEVGVASWYGHPYHGRPAADGEIYDMETLVAAHRVMPFNTWIKVTNLANDKSVNVRIIDRGPFVNGRILDLSKAAARDIDLLGPGIGKVRIEVISAPRDKPVNDFYSVQVGAFAQRDTAERLRSHYAERFGNAQLAYKAGPSALWRVLVGKEPSLEAAQQLAIVLTAENKSAYVVRLDQDEIEKARRVHGE